jgi:hypothetical protein
MAKNSLFYSVKVQDQVYVVNSIEAEEHFLDLWVAGMQWRMTGYEMVINSLHSDCQKNCLVKKPRMICFKSKMIYDNT